MKVLKYTLLSFLFTALYSCTEDDINTLLGSDELTDTEIVEGLKEALIVGTDTSTTNLAKEGGYYNDLDLRIPLPPSVESSIANLKSKTINLGITTVTGADLYNGINVLGITFPGLKNTEDDLIEGINAAAEDAANTAGPIFYDAVGGITFSDAYTILFGGIDTAATSYLRSNTYNALFSEYEPKIENALQSVSIGNTSVVDSYEDFVADYNALLNTNIPGFGTVSALTGVNTIAATDLSDHGTHKGLDGLFKLIAQEEENIRTNPLARVTSILESVFGALD